MATVFSGSDFNGSKAVTLDDGTYPATLESIKIYKNDNFEKTGLVTQLDLTWDTGDVVENDDGKEVPALIYQTFVNLSFNKKAKLSDVLRALFGREFDPVTCKVSIEIEDHASPATLEHRSEAKANITSFLVNGEEIVGKQAMVAVTTNDAGYNRVTSISAPMRASKRPIPVGAPA